MDVRCTSCGVVSNTGGLSKHDPKCPTVQHCGGFHDSVQALTQSAVSCLSDTGGDGGYLYRKAVEAGVESLVRSKGRNSQPTIWFVQQAEGNPADLQVALQQLTAQGWTVVNILTNGINRWTVVASKEA